MAIKRDRPTAVKWADNWLKEKALKEVDRNTTRNKFIESLDSGKGAIDFVKVVEEFGTNEKGEKLRIRNWNREYLRLIADVRVAHTVTSGAAQVGKTLAHTLLHCYVVANGSLNSIWAYSQERVLHRLVPLQFRPIMQNWLKTQGINLKKSEGSQNNLLYSINGGNALFTYVSTGASASSGQASAGSAVVSVSADIAFLEERSQYPAGAASPVERRLDAGRLANHPIRELGTPGSGQGIEASLKKCDRNFYPALICKECEKLTFLHPYGALLLPVDRVNTAGEKVSSYLSDSLRPVDWLHKDKQNPTESAYIGCQHCRAEISQEERAESFFACLNTGERLTEFLDKLDGDFDKRWMIGIQLSPLLREVKYNLAAEIIGGGLSSDNASDFIQQRLGLASETNSTAITQEMILRAMNTSPPTDRETVTLAGIDQGRAADSLVIIRFHMPQKRGEPSYDLENSHREIVFAGAVPRAEIPSILANYEVTGGAIDQEPDITSAFDFCRLTGFVMVDQQGRQIEYLKKGESKDGGENFSVYKVSNPRFLKRTLSTFVNSDVNGYPLVSVSADWTVWLQNDTERSPIKQLQSPSFDPETLKWVKSSTPDHTYYAMSFCETAFYIYITGIESQLNDWFALT